MSARARPAAWLHTLHMEMRQTHKQVTFTRNNPFGVRGRDYDPSYKVTTEPLFRAPKKEKP